MTLAVSQDLAPYVPRLATELAGTPGATWTSIDGSMLSADISGFTALSEKLAGKGKAGAEEITSLINTCFTALIDSAYDYGGEVIKFGGDALLVLFRGDDHERRVANASLAMQIALHSSTAAKRANLTMTVGASHGPFDVFMAGSDYRDLLIIGPAASNVIFLEGEADKGETLVSPEIATHVPDTFIGREHAGGLAISGEPFDPPSGPSARPWLSDDLSPFVPPQVIEQLAAFAELGGEHRIVSVGFVMVAGVRDQLDAVGPQGTADALGRLIDDILAATAPYGVTALHTDIADDGFKVVLCAGAPVNPGDTSDALLQAALDIAAVSSPFVIRQGCQTGRVFAGFLGSPYRRTYTLMGDPVNTAARMLGKADDRDVVAVGTMVADTRTIFASEELEPFLVKGKTEPIVAHKIRGVTDEVRRGGAATRLYGREKELKILTSAIGELGEAIDIVGPAGVGKSRLLDAAWDAAEGMRFFQGSCTPYGAASPYSVFRPLLRNGIDIPTDADPVEAGRLLAAFVAEAAPALLPMLPLIAVPFGAEVPATPEADAIDPEFRRQRTHESIVNLYDTTLGTTPVFLVIEDLQWVDDASGDLVDHLIRAAATRPWAGVLTRRPGGSWQPDDSATHVTTLDLQPLSADAVKQLAIDASTTDLSDAALDAIVHRSNGNPLFALELAAAAGRGDGTDLPDTVEKVISSRIDDLSPDLRRLVRVASVFGTRFEPANIETVLADHSTDLSLGDEGLADILEPVDDERWGFRHALYRDVAYEGLPFQQRRELHSAVARTLEDRAEDPRAIAALLSLHYSEAGTRDLAWRYSVLAGRDAFDAGANVEAADAYARAVKATPASTLPAERAEVLEALGDAEVMNGHGNAAEQAFSKARRHAAALADELRLRRKIGSLREQAGRPSTALRWYLGALKALDAADDALEAERARLLLAAAGVRHRQGQHRACLDLAREAEEYARAADDRAALALAHDRQHIGLVYLGDARSDEHGEAGLVLYREEGDTSAEARLLNNLGIGAYYRGEWTTAAQYYAEAVEKSHAAGNVIESGFGALNQAEILADQGHWSTAIDILGDVLRNWGAAEYGPGIAITLAYRGIAKGRAGQVAEGLADIDEAIERFTEIGSTELIGEARVRGAEINLVDRNRDAAEAMLADLRGQATEKPALGRRIDLLDAVAAAQEGNDATADLASLVDIGTTAPDYEAAVAEHLLEIRSPGTSSGIRERLGIVAVAPFLS